MFSSTGHSALPTHTIRSLWTICRADISQQSIFWNLVIGESPCSADQKFLQPVRYEGYVYALQEAGIPLDKTLIRAGKLNMEFGREFAKKIILHSDNPPSAVFVGGDFTCYGLMDACIRAGIRIPEDLSIVSFDDIPFSDTAMVNLTTISHPYTQIGELVAKKIVHRIEQMLLSNKSHCCQPL